MHCKISPDQVLQAVGDWPQKHYIEWSGHIITSYVLENMFKGV